MGPTEVLGWFEEIASRSITYHGGGSGRLPQYDLAEASTWVTDAQSALQAVFSPAHPVMARWKAALTTVDNGRRSDMSAPTTVQATQAIFRSALAQLKAGRLTSFAQSIQAETVAELLDQADALLSGGYAVAATVIAGGALETHLCHLCQQNGLSLNGNGSISKYDQAIAQHRNQTGQGIYSAVVGKSITPWGGMRNEAAHDPANFSHSDAEVRLMVDGVRQFIARTS